MWTGVDLYSGRPDTNLTKIGTVYGGDSSSIAVQYPDGHLEWKSRKALILSDNVWVRCDDPAINLEQWRKMSP